MSGQHSRDVSFFLSWLVWVIAKPAARHIWQAHLRLSSVFNKSNSPTEQQNKVKQVASDILYPEQWHLTLNGVRDLLGRK